MSMCILVNFVNIWLCFLAPAPILSYFPRFVYIVGDGELWNDCQQPQMRGAQFFCNTRRTNALQLWTTWFKAVD